MIIIKWLPAWWCNNHLEKYEFVNCNMYEIEKNIHVWNHQPVYFLQESTMCQCTISCFWILSLFEVVNLLGLWYHIELFDGNYPAWTSQVVIIMAQATYFMGYPWYPALYYSYGKQQALFSPRDMIYEYLWISMNLWRWSSKQV